MREIPFHFASTVDFLCSESCKAQFNVFLFLMLYYAFLNY